MKKRISDLIKKYQKKLYLDLWTFTFEVSKDGEDDEGGIASITVNSTYRTGHLVIYKRAFDKPNSIDDVIRHELCHCLTDRLYVYCNELLQGKLRTAQDISEQNESLTEWISILIK